MSEKIMRTIGDLESGAAQPRTSAPRLSEPGIRLPDDDASQSSASTPGVVGQLAGVGQATPTIVDRITKLEQMKTNFVFPFGRSNSGKTVAMSSLIHYMSSVHSGGKLHEWGSDYGSADDTHTYIREVNRMFANRIFPSRTTFDALHWDRTRHINVDFVPNQPGRKRLRITFVDMAGEDHYEFASSDGKRGLPPGIEIFFQAKNLSLTFVLVTRHQDASDDDAMMVSFLNHIIKADPRFENARVLLLVSNWDTYDGEDGIETFIKERMPTTYAKTLNPHNAMIDFTIGSVGMLPGDAAPFLREYAPGPARKVLHWFYRAHTGTSLERISWWKKLVRSV